MNDRFKVMLAELTSIVKIAAREELLPRFESQQFERRTKQDGSVVTDADRAMQQRIALAFQDRWPEIKFLGEEMPAQEQQQLLHHHTVCCVDPVDGTSNFASGIPFFAVSLAIIEHQRPVLGLVYDPLRDECFTAASGNGCWLNGEAIPVFAGSDDSVELKKMIAVVDLKRLSGASAATIATQHPYRSQRNFGSCALEWCWLAAGRIQLYLHGGQKLWDYAAGVLILEQAGGQSSTLAGERVFSATLDPRSVVAACHPDIYEQWYTWLESHISA